MPSRSRFIALLAVCVCSGAVRPARADDAPLGAELFARMQRVNAELRSYQADVHVDVKLHSFPPISPSFDGTAYFKQPDKNAVIFNTVPLLAQAFKRVYPQIEPPSEWAQIYDVVPVADDGAASRFRLTPKKNGRIDRVEVSVDDRTATVTSMAYFYRDGGSISFSQTYDRIGGVFVVRSQTGKVDLPRYNADIASEFSNYRINVPIDDAVFATE